MMGANTSWLNDFTGSKNGSPNDSKTSRLTDLSPNDFDERFFTGCCAVNLVDKLYFDEVQM